MIERTKELVPIHHANDNTPSWFFFPFPANKPIVDDTNITKQFQMIILWTISEIYLWQTSTSMNQKRINPLIVEIIQIIIKFHQSYRIPMQRSPMIDLFEQNLSFEKNSFVNQCRWIILYLVDQQIFHLLYLLDKLENSNQHNDHNQYSKQYLFKERNQSIVSLQYHTNAKFLF